MAKKKQNKKTIYKRKPIQITTSKKDDRDKPSTIRKISMARNVSRLIREGKIKEKEIQAKRVEEKKQKTKSNNIPSKKTSTSKSSKKRAKTVYVNPYISGIKEIEKKKITKKDIGELKRIKKNLQNAKYRLDNKIKSDVRKKKKSNKLTKTELNKLNKDTLNLTVAVNEINKKLGYGKKFKEAPKQKTKRKKIKEKEGEKIVKKNIQEDIYPVWEARENIAKLLKNGFYNEYIIKDKTLSKGEVPRIFLEFTLLEHSVYATGTTTPRVVFIKNITDRTVEITVY